MYSKRLPDILVITLISVLLSYILVSCCALSFNKCIWVGLGGTGAILLAFMFVAQNAYDYSLFHLHNTIRDNRILYNFLNQYKDIPIFMNEGISDSASEQNRQYETESNRTFVRVQCPENSIIYAIPDEWPEECILLTRQKDIENQTLENLQMLGVVIDNKTGYDVRIKGTNLVERVKRDKYPVYTKLEILEWPDVRIECDQQDLKINRGDIVNVNVQFKCDNQKAFINEHKYALSYHIYDENGEIRLWDGRRQPFSMIYDGMENTLMIDEETFLQPGHYILKLDVVKEGEFWLSERGMVMPAIAVTVK